MCASLGIKPFNSEPEIPPLWADPGARLRELQIKPQVYENLKISELQSKCFIYSAQCRTVATWTKFLIDSL